jgi:hypothetical protein
LVDNFCVDSFGTGTVVGSGFVGPSSGAQVDLKCPGSGTTTFVLGQIWGEQVQ